VALVALPGATLRGSQGWHRLHEAIDGGRARAVQDQGERFAASLTLTARVQRLLAGNAHQQAGLFWASASHIADMAGSLASDEAAITIGQIPSVDSGVTID
jgi:hypothetical protein